MKIRSIFGCIFLLSSQMVFGLDAGASFEEALCASASEGDRQDQDATQTPSSSYSSPDGQRYVYKKDKCRLHQSSRFQLGGNYTHVTMHPHDEASFIGNLGGMLAMYDYRPMNSIYAAAKLAWHQGNTHGSDGERFLVYVDAQERIGYSFESYCHRGIFSLYTGVGYRHLGHKLTPSIGSKIRFKYNEIYVPLGTAADFSITSWFGMGLGLVWMPQVYPTVKILPLQGARWTLRKKIANFAVELPFTFTWPKHKDFSLILNPYYERWQDGHTTAVTSTGNALGLPSNTYNFWGFDLNLAFSF